jgi:hypothetical protein
LLRKEELYRGQLNILYIVLEVMHIAIYMVAVGPGESEN